MPVSLDLPVELHRLPGGQHRAAAAAGQRRIRWRRPSWPGAPHGQEDQVLGQQARGDGAEHVAIQQQVDAVQVSPDGQGPPGQARPDGQRLPSTTVTIPLGWHAGLELHRPPAGRRSRWRLDHPDPQLLRWRLQPGRSAFCRASSREGPCGRNTLAGVAIPSDWCGRAWL